MLRKQSLTRCTSRGLSALFLTLLLTSCALEPTLTKQYVAVPVTSNLDLLCNPKAPPPPRSADGRKPNSATLGQEYVHQLIDVIEQCARQQQEYRNELNRLVEKAKKESK